ncbi:MAG: DUF177 domain-containing protein [Actinomycetota bacterium]|nr:DUF177 domain-containing protein [Actinomycetota bacterium]MCL6093153.1 DUF177 domain-containing protein [Actinomycetota bacterium]MDA8167630.1 DUF177 domain-containing protein [Actinomycetota bacterium]
MPKQTPTSFDLAAQPLVLGVSRTFELNLYLPPLHLAGQDYGFVPDVVAARLTVAYVGEGYTAKLEFSCRLEGACWRCLEPADLDLDVSADDYFETELPPVEEIGDEEEASLWFMEDGTLNLSEWARSAIAELLPPQILCQEDCKGLCPQCGTNLNAGQCDCEPPADERWGKLREWKAAD